jgi:transcriptional regulator with XRE-family HTH domain
MNARKRDAGRRGSAKHPDRDTVVGAYVRSRRRDERLTQRGLAELAGVAPKVIWELEHGKRTMRMDVVNAVLRVFGKTLGVVDTVRPEVDE